MKLLSFMTLATLLSLAACSHCHKDKQCADKESCPKEKMSCCKDKDAKAQAADCKDGKCQKTSKP